MKINKFIFFIVLFLWVNIARADIVVLRNGKTFSGVITAVLSDQITFKQDNQDYIINFNQIDKIAESPQGNINSSNLSKAQELYKEAAGKYIILQNHEKETNSSQPPVEIYVAKTPPDGSIQVYEPVPTVPALVPKSAKLVEFYLTSWCPWCKKMKSFLNSEGISYKSYDIEKSREGKRKYDKLGVSGVPVVVVDGTVIKGYDPERVQEALR